MPIYRLSRAAPIGYDEAAGFVISAPDEKTARYMAAMQCGDEGGKTWLSPALSFCVEVESIKPYAIILRDFRAG